MPREAASATDDAVRRARAAVQALAARGYAYQFIYARNAAHVDGPTLSQTLALALQWAWNGYPRR